MRMTSTRRLLPAMAGAAMLFGATTFTASADVIVGAAPLTGNVSFQTPYPDCPAIGPDRWTFTGVATGVVVDADVIAGYRGDIQIGATGNSSGAFCDAAETGAISVNTASGRNAQGGGIDCIQKDSSGNPIPLNGGYVRFGTHVHATVSGVCTIDTFVNKLITFQVEGDFYTPDPTKGNGITQPITSAAFAGAVTVEPDPSQPLAAAPSPPCSGGGAPRSGTVLPVNCPV
jgi:hypothetical protein